jgi:phage host-nuclease inhibitor protein Gam
MLVESDEGRACSQLSGMVNCLRHLAERRIIVSVLTRFKSNEKLQAEALDILREMIRRELLTVSVVITDPQTSLSCRVMDAFERRTATQKEITRELLTGEPIKKKGAEGIELVLGQKFRLSSDDETRQFRDQMRKVEQLVRDQTIKAENEVLRGL